MMYHRWNNKDLDAGSILIHQNVVGFQEFLLPWRETMLTPCRDEYSSLARSVIDGQDNTALCSHSYSAGRLSNSLEQANLEDKSYNHSSDIVPEHLQSVP